MALVVIGADVGQRRDPTAIAVAEYDERPEPGAPTERVALLPGGARVVEPVRPPTVQHWLVRHLERLPLGTSYPDVAARIAAVAAAVRARVGDTPRLYVDATGVGTPLVDVLKGAKVQARITPVYFTHGDKRTLGDAGEVTLGKAFLVSRLQALLQTGCLHLPRTAEAEQLGKELLDYEIKIDQNANDTYGAFRVGTHDDLVTALGLATQPVRRWMVL